MRPNPNKLCYSFAPIRDLNTLAEVLALAPAQLDQLVRNADRMYRPVPQKKKEGKLRMTWDAFPQLKAVQQLLNARILTKVSYPLYLQAGIRDRKNPRDYARNAAIHAGQACIINEDIANFFPSTTAEQVREIWEDFFRFSPDVALFLTALTTRCGELPQGAKTSSYLANLVFWRNEHDLFRHFEANGFRYSRLADDMTVSSSRALSTAEKSNVMSTLYTFIRRHGYSPKYSKHAIFSRGKRMLVNNLVANRHPALPHEERSAIRALVHRTVVQLEAGNEPTIARSMPTVLGKLGKLKRFHGRTGVQLGARLKNALGRWRAAAGKSSTC